MKYDRYSGALVVRMVNVRYVYDGIYIVVQHSEFLL